jgi:hypothetical protein
MDIQVPDMDAALDLLLEVERAAVFAFRRTDQTPQEELKELDRLDPVTREISRGLRFE